MLELEVAACSPQQLTLASTARRARQEPDRSRLRTDHPAGPRLQSSFLDLRRLAGKGAEPEKSGGGNAGKDGTALRLEGKTGTVQKLE